MKVNVIGIDPDPDLTKFVSLEKLGFPWASLSAEGYGVLYNKNTHKLYVPSTDSLKHAPRFIISNTRTGPKLNMPAKNLVGYCFYDKDESLWEKSDYKDSILEYKYFFDGLKSDHVRPLGVKYYARMWNSTIEYYVDRDGNLWALRGIILRKHQACKNDDGYLEVKLCRTISVKLHRLIAYAFCPIPSELADAGFGYRELQVNHIDGNPANNHYSNLEWVTGEQNVHHSYKTKTERKDGHTHVSDELIEIICQEFLKGTGNRELSRKYGVGMGVLDNLRYLVNRPRYIKLLKKYRWRDTFTYKGKKYHIDDDFESDHLDSNTLERLGLQ